MDRRLRFPVKAACFGRWVAVVTLISGILAVVPRATDAQARGSSGASAATASLEPKVIDQAWQRASAKYDEARAAILEEVDRKGREGPFRPDLEMSGIREICIERNRTSTSTTSPRMGRWISLGTRILFRCSGRNGLTRRRGPGSLRRREPNM